MSQSRRLAAILAADVAGYSRLMGFDEVGTARALRDHRAAADPLIGGRNLFSGVRAGRSAIGAEGSIRPAAARSWLPPH
jgi:hypothetical protein